MLAYLLALVVGLSSVALYMAAFFFPEVHRKHDFLWSGLGLFYALVLWVCAGRITGGVLLGQTASVVLLGWMGWQTLTLRRQVAADQQTAVPTSSEWQAAISQVWAGVSRSKAIAPITQPIGNQVAKLVAWIEALVTTTKAPTPLSTKVEPPPYVPLTPADFANARQEAESPAKMEASETIAAEVTPTQTSRRVPRKKSVQPKENPLTAIAKQAQNAFKGLSDKRESKPVYVRKQFRAPDTFEAEAQEAIDGSDAKTSSHADLETAVPEPPIVEAPTSETMDATTIAAEIDAAAVDAAEIDAKDSAAPPPGVNEVNPVSNPEQSS